MPELTYLSLGWGVQSWTIAAMVALGDLPPIDLAIHSDTGHEAAGTYAHAEKWTHWLEERGVRVVTVKPENNDVIREDWGIESGTPSIQIPAFTLAQPDATLGQKHRQCTREWKITPIRRHLRSILGPGRLKPGSLVCWQGISLDEWSRMRDSDVKYIRNVYPLVDRRMTRLDCAQWLQQNGLDIPQKSACVFCPFHSRAEWHQLKQQGRQRLGPRDQCGPVNPEKARHHGYFHPSLTATAGRSGADTRGRESPAIGAGPALRRGRVLRVGTGEPPQININQISTSSSRKKGADKGEKNEGNRQHS